jgi:hypothetical protein
MLATRFEMAVNNLEKIQNRVAEAIEELNDDGKDTEAASEFLNLSKEKLGDAKDKVAEIKALVPASGEEMTPEIFEKIKLLAREAKDLLKESREDLRRAIHELKELRGEKNDDSE